MKRVVQVKLLPTPVQDQALSDTVALCNTVANDVARIAADVGVFKNRPLRALTYRDAKAAGLSAQPAQHVIKKVADAFTTLRANARNGRYGPKGSPSVSTFSETGSRVYSWHSGGDGEVVRC